MIRKLTVVACLVAIAMAAPIGSYSSAEAKAIACKASNIMGKQSKWKCKADQKCCYNWVEDKGGCVAKSAICL